MYRPIRRPASSPSRLSPASRLPHFDFRPDLAGRAGAVEPLSSALLSSPSSSPSRALPAVHVDPPSLPPSFLRSTARRFPRLVLPLASGIPTRFFLTPRPGTYAQMARGARRIASRRVVSSSFRPASFSLDVVWLAAPVRFFPFLRSLIHPVRTYVFKPQVK